jgi:hypothetical protein
MIAECGSGFGKSLFWDVRLRDPRIHGGRIVKALGHYSQDYAVSTVKLESASDNGRVASESSLPNGIGQQNGRGSAGLILVGLEDTADQGLMVGTLKKGPGNEGATSLLRYIRHFQFARRYAKAGVLRPFRTGHERDPARYHPGHSQAMKGHFISGECTTSRANADTEWQCAELPLSGPITRQHG